MKINPEYTAAKARQGEPTTVSKPDKALAIISTADDMMTASDIMAKDKLINKPIEMSASSASSSEIIQDPEFLAKFKAPKPIDGGELLDNLYKSFAKYEVPIGLINKLLKLSEFKLSFRIDDSGSMTDNSDVSFAEASVYTQKYKNGLSPNTMLTRWQEAEDRLHTMIDFIGFIPTNGIAIKYLNKFDSKGELNKPLILEQKGKSPEKFIADAHEAIATFFNKIPCQRTPIFTALKEDLEESKDDTMHYLFSDGLPNDGGDEKAVEGLIVGRRNPQKQPITLISCSNNDEDTEWMKTLEEKEDIYVSELDDFKSERREVEKDQGPAFPYSRGMWLLSNLVAAICPFDLDAMDESIPFTKCTLDNLFGRKLNPNEYQYYFLHNPNAKIYNALFSQFIREDIEAHAILDAIRKQNGLTKKDVITERHINAYTATLSKGTMSLVAPIMGYTPPPSYQEAVSGTAAPGYSGMMFATAPPMSSTVHATEYKLPFRP